MAVKPVVLCQCESCECCGFIRTEINKLTGSICALTLHTHSPYAHRTKTTYSKKMAAQVRRRRGRPSANQFIVNPAIVIPMANMTNLHFNSRQFVLQFLYDEETCLSMCARYGLIHNTYTCSRCGVPCVLHHCARQLAKDKCYWNCPTCGGLKSVRQGSFFARSHMSLIEILQIIYHWANDHRATEIVRDLDVHWHTVVDWTNFIRDICAYWVRDHSGPIGGLDAQGNPKVLCVKVH